MSQEDRLTGLVGYSGMKVPVLAATIAAITLSGEQTIDGVAVVDGDRVLVKDQATAADNGIYVVDTGAWDRAQDADGPYDFVRGSLVFVYGGTVNGTKTFQQTVADPLPDTTSLTFTQAFFSSSSAISFLQAGTGAVSRTAQDKMRDVVSLKDFGAVGDGVTDDTAAINAAVAYMQTLGNNPAGNPGGGIIYAPNGTYKMSEVTIDYPQIIIEGCSAGYDYNDAQAGAVFYCTTGDFAFHLKRSSAGLAALGSGFRRCSIQSTQVDATNVEYGVLITCPMTVMEDVTVQGFKNGVSGMGFNSNVFERCAILWNTKCGFALTPPAEKAYTHPNVLADIFIDSTYPSTKWSMRDCNIRRNYVGQVIRDGDTVTLDRLTIENNEHAGTILFNSAGSLSGPNGPYNYRFRDCWYEGNYAGWAGPNSGLYSLTGVLACKTSSTQYLNGTVNGQWASTASQATTDAGYNVWMGSTTEADPASATMGLIASYYDTKKLCYNVEFDNCSFASPFSIKVRAGWQTTLRDCTYYYGTGDGITPTTPIYAVLLTAQAYDTLIWGGKSRIDNLASAAGTRTCVVRRAGGVTGEVSGLVLEQGTLRINNYPVGVWTTPTFAAGTYTANASMTWTVAAGDVTTNEYTITNKKMTWVLNLGTTTVGGTPSFELQVAIPASKVATKTVIVPVRIRDNGVSSIGYMYVVAGGSTLKIYKIDDSNWTASTDNTSVQGQITFEIN